MIFDIISDIHLDFYISPYIFNIDKIKEQVQKFINRHILPDESIGECLIIVGDIGHNNIQNKVLLSEFKKIYKNVVITYGNHDLYLYTDEQQQKYNYNSFDRLQEIKEFCTQNNIYFLDGNVINIDGIKIGGTCGWYKITEKNYIKWYSIMNDARLIFNGSKDSTINPTKMYIDELNKIKNIIQQECDILCTHVGLIKPSIDEGMPLKYVNDSSNEFFYNECTNLIEKSNIKYHIFGHTHSRYNFIRNNVHYICNPFGYPNEQYKDFIKIEVDT